MFLHRYFFRTKLVVLCAIGALIAPAVALAAEPTEHETLSLKAAPLFQIGKFAVTNSMLASWIVALAVILFAQIATRNIKTVPTGAQNFWEWLVESLYNFLEGDHRTRAGAENVLVLRHHFHFHSVRQLVGTDSRRRDDRLGT